MATRHARSTKPLIFLYIYSRATRSFSVPDENTASPKAQYGAGHKHRNIHSTVGNTQAWKHAQEAYRRAGEREGPYAHSSRLQSSNNRTPRKLQPTGPLKRREKVTSSLGVTASRRARGLEPRLLLRSRGQAFLASRRRRSCSPETRPASAGLRGRGLQRVVHRQRHGQRTRAKEGVMQGRPKRLEENKKEHGEKMMKKKGGRW